MSTQSGDGWGKEERRREGGGIKGEMWGRRVGWEGCGLNRSEELRGGDSENYKITGPKAHPTAFRRGYVRALKV